MKKPINTYYFVLLVITLLCLVFALDSKADTSTSAGVDAPATEAASSPVKYQSMDQHDLFDSAEEVTPTLDYECPYEFSKCVVTVDYMRGGEHATTWDVYLYIYDGILGTWIVNETGNQISFYGDAYLYCIGEEIMYNVHMGRYLTDGEKQFTEAHVCAYPSGEDYNQFTVVTSGKLEPVLSPVTVNN